MLTKYVSGDLFIPIQGDVNAVFGVSPPSISEVFLQCLICLPSYGFSPASLASCNRLLISTKFVSNLKKEPLFGHCFVISQQCCNDCVVHNSSDVLNVDVWRERGGVKEQIVGNSEGPRTIRTLVRLE